MSLPASIFAKLSDAASATAAIVGSGATCRVYPGQAPQIPTAPYVVFSGISSDADTTHDASSDHDLAVIQFSIIAETYLAAWQLRRAIRSDLSDIELDGGEKPVDFTERDGFAEGVEAHVLMLDVSIWHNPSAA